MADPFFQSKPGLAVPLTDSVGDDSENRTLLRIRPADGSTFGFEEHRAIVTNYQESDSVNFQAMPTLDRRLYLYTFGDRLGQATIQGTAFRSACRDPEERHGISRVDDWYRNHRLRADPLAIELMLGDSDPRLGYLVSLNKQTSNPKHRLGAFSMTVLLPTVSLDEAEADAADPLNPTGLA